MNMPYQRDVCVKTGLWWREAGSTVVHTGDLFYTAGGWQVRGVPRGVPYARFAPRDGAHAIFESVPLYPRSGAPWLDSALGVTMVAVSDELRRHVTDWYAHLHLHTLLPTQRIDP